MGRMCTHARTQSERKRVIMREGEEERDNENETEKRKKE